MVSVAGHSLNECVAGLRGPAGSQVKLVVIPAGQTEEQAYPLTLTRRILPLLEAERLGQLGGPHVKADILAATDADKAAQAAPREVVLKKFTGEDKLVSQDCAAAVDTEGHVTWMLTGFGRDWLTKQLAEAIKSKGENDPQVKELRARIEAQARLVSQPRVVRLFEVPNPNLEDCTVLYRAKLSTVKLEGRAYLEMWCRFPGLGEAFSRGLDQTVSGSNDAVSCQIPFFLKKGERPDLIRLNVVIEGEGTVCATDIELVAAVGGSQASAGEAPEPAAQPAAPANPKSTPSAPH
jgi:hypothetical protein